MNIAFFKSKYMIIAKGNNTLLKTDKAFGIPVLSFFCYT